MIMAFMNLILYAFNGCSANLWSACWQGGVMVCIVWTICRLLPTMPTRWQCWFWRLALLKFVVVLCLPTLIRVPLLPAHVEIAHLKSTTIATPTLPVQGANITAENTIAMEETLDYHKILCILWAIGIVVALFRLTLALHAANQVIKRACPIDRGPIFDELSSQSQLFGLRTIPKLFVIPGSGSPMLFGLLRPCLIIPAETLKHLKSAELTMVLGHELAHVRRHDLYWSLAASLIRVVFFFHPLVWLAQRQMKLAQEIAADQLAISRQRHDPLGYGKLLVAVLDKLGSKVRARSLVSTITLETAGPIYSLTRRLFAMSRIGRTSRCVLIGSMLLLIAVVFFGLVPWKLIAAEPKTGENRAKQFYEARICVNERKNEQPAQQLMAPTLVYSTGQWCFAAFPEYDPKEVLLIAVSSSEGKDVSHYVQVRALRDPRGKDLTKEDIDRLIQEDIKHLPDKENCRTDDLPKKNLFSIIVGQPGKTDAEKKKNAFVVSMSCDQDAKLAEPVCDAKGYHPVWHSMLLQVPTGSIGNIGLSWLDGSRSIEIQVTVSPTEAPQSVAAKPLENQEAASQAGSFPADRPSYRVDAESYHVDIREHGKRVSAIENSSGKSVEMDVPENMKVTDVYVGDHMAACLLHGTPVSQLILYDHVIDKWATFDLPEADRPQDVKAILGDTVACYPLKGRIVAYSSTTHTWDTLATDAEPCVGDFSVKVETTDKISEFSKATGVWKTQKRSDDSQ